MLLTLKCTRPQLIIKVHGCKMLDFKLVKLLFFGNAENTKIVTDLIFFATLTFKIKVGISILP